MSLARQPGRLAVGCPTATSKTAAVRLSGVPRAFAAAMRALHASAGCFPAAISRSSPSRSTLYRPSVHSRNTSPLATGDATRLTAAMSSRPKTARERGALGVLQRALGADETHTPPSPGHGVVLGQLRDLRRADAIEPTVAHVRRVKGAAVEDDRRERSRHAAKLRDDECPIVNLDVGLLNGSVQALGRPPLRRTFAVGAQRHVDRHPARDFAAFLAADAVSDGDEHLRPFGVRAARILVGTALGPRIRYCCKRCRVRGEVARARHLRRPNISVKTAGAE